jgi:hypothetical protein
MGHGIERAGGGKAASRASRTVSEIRPLLASASSVLRTCAAPRSRAAGFTSIIVTGNPALRNARVMPLPIVPAPITATEAIATSPQSRATGTLAAARSAKKMWRCAADSGLAISSSNSSHSRVSPASNGRSVAASIARTMLPGALKPTKLLALRAR